MGTPTYKQSKVRDTIFGERVTIVEPANIYQAKIGSDSFVGPFTEIQKNVVIGERCKIQSHSFICELVTIGNDCFIGHGVVFINDDFRAGGTASSKGATLKPTFVGDRVCIGSNCSILPVSICSDTVIGAGSVVTKNIEEPGYYAGNPAVKLRNINSQ